MLKQGKIKREIHCVHVHVSLTRRETTENQSSKLQFAQSQQPRVRSVGIHLLPFYEISFFCLGKLLYLSIAVVSSFPVLFRCRSSTQHPLSIPLLVLLRSLTSLFQPQPRTRGPRAVSPFSLQPPKERRKKREMNIPFAYFI